MSFSVGKIWDKATDCLCLRMSNRVAGEDSIQCIYEHRLRAKASEALAELYG
jgi:hypothetical protein